MRIYISGPMRSQPDMGQAMFAQAAVALRAAGHYVYVPTEQPGALEARGGHGVRRVLADNLTWLCVQADAVVVLPGWRSSRGTKAEVASAKALPVPVYELEDFLLDGLDADEVVWP